MALSPHCGHAAATARVKNLQTVGSDLQVTDSSTAAFFRLAPGLLQTVGSNPIRHRPE